MIDIIGFMIESVRMVTAFALLLFIPGFALMLIFYPKPNDIPVFERVALSGILSIGTAIGGLLILDLFLGIDTTTENSFLALSAITVIALTIWRVELFLIERRETRRGASRSLLASVTTSRYFHELARIYRAGEDRINAYSGKNRTDGNRKE